ncbi:TlpA disulfide reductase family protein [Pedobacter psychroterrae]|uniref:AhpC/TSA family protein n=1 Tax=Pedobacter psychroterrae TaxID=2530453 RepID=A0A4R0NEM3_9SPHI|nr:TlpA disulfide reductase family protein [Pedobacter psychroterrae]TCC98157.1 AhpC/TSA family protein [Pedobacter psychroterrae]
MNTRIKSTFALLLLVCATVLNTFAAPKPFTLNGEIKGLPEGTKLKLVPGATHASEDPIAEATVKAGKFVLTGQLDGPRLFYVTIADAFGGYTLMLEPGKITLKGEASAVERGDSKGYEFKNMEVKGSKLQALYLQKKAPRAMLDSLHNANNIKHKEVSIRRGEAMQKKDTAAVAAITKSAEWQLLEADSKAFFAKVDTVFNKMIGDNKDTFWGPLIMLDLYSYFTDQQKPQYAQFTKAAKESHYGKILNEVLNPEGFKGKAAPLFDMKANNNAAADVASLVKGHKYVLVDFWASWCVPCRKSIPGLKTAYEELKDKGLQIVSISIDKKEADWQKAETEENLPWPSFLDNGKTSNAWKIRAIPAMFLLNDKGVVVGENMTLAQVKELMK